jgi:hypothetical protein
MSRQKHITLSTLNFLFLLFCRFDCGFYCILYIDQFTGKSMPDFTSEAIPDFRKILAASLINNRDNAESVEKLMDEELQAKKGSRR